MRTCDLGCGLIASLGGASIGIHTGVERGNWWLVVPMVLPFLFVAVFCIRGLILKCSHSSANTGRTSRMLAVLNRVGIRSRGTLRAWLWIGIGCVGVYIIVGVFAYGIQREFEWWRFGFLLAWAALLADTVAVMYVAIRRAPSTEFARHMIVFAYVIGICAVLPIVLLEVGLWCRYALLVAATVIVRIGFEVRLALGPK